MWNDFKEFVARGNVFDLAVGLVIGGAFATVVKSFVDDILMPPLGFLSGGTDFSALYINLSGAEYESLAKAQEAGAATINYGRFLSNVIAFLIVAFAVFLLVRAYNRLSTRNESLPAEPAGRDCPFCRLTIPLTATRCPHCTSQLTTP
ncbi:MAG: Large-conductance mechanosensitive channel [uncultured Gemmatimonadetes bacterium]|uniref:Large-conductance mechanosensitive channel n=1 Tax=uncultured Gemmatimonadota bacterium TaxID=203437 RepID=A0A6J4M506_9BACT|nr:MAG: Large-conductance mechanosensitive channel [uncultured Gemmatimonadota bacterium]